MKIHTLRLSFPHINPNSARIDERLYRVEQVTDSVEYAPNQTLTRSETEQLCHSKAWKVTIVPVR